MAHWRWKVGLGATAIAIAVAAAGCAHGPRDYLWVDEVPKTMIATERAYRISPGDVIGIRVWNQEANSIDSARVREDGKISLPFLNDVEVAGMEPAELARRLEVKLKAFIVNPAVTVVLRERRPLKISVIGQVARPGAYDLDFEAPGVVQAIAAAGGLTAFANRDSIYVLRAGYWAEDSSPARIRFRWDDVSRAKIPAATFTLQRGDVVVAE